MSKKTPDEIRAALAMDPNTAQIAETLKMPLEDYVKLVVHYATTGAEPEYFIVPDADLKKLGHTPPDARKMNAWLAEAAAMKLATEVTDYSSGAARPKVSLAVPPAAPAALNNDPALAAEIRSRRTGSRN
jgi:hypothetical protein